MWRLSGPIQDGIRLAQTMRLQAATMRVSEKATSKPGPSTHVLTLQCGAVFWRLIIYSNGFPHSFSSETRLILGMERIYELILSARLTHMHPNSGLFFTGVKLRSAACLPSSLHSSARLQHPPRSAVGPGLDSVRALQMGEQRSRRYGRIEQIGLLDPASDPFASL